MRISSQLEICNLALIRIRQAPVANLDDNIIQARNCKLVYEQSRSSVLSRYNWWFATKTERLKKVYDATLISFTPEEEKQLTEQQLKQLEKLRKLYEKYKFIHRYLYEYQLPRDFLSLVQVTSGGKPVVITPGATKPAYLLEYSHSFLDVGIPAQRVLKSDNVNCELKYVFDIEDVNLFPAYFIDCLVLEIAKRLSADFIDNVAKQQMIISEFNMAFEEAKIRDAQQSQEEFGIVSPLQMDEVTII